MLVFSYHLNAVFFKKARFLYKVAIRTALFFRWRVTLF